MPLPHGTACMEPKPSALAANDPFAESPAQSLYFQADQVSRLIGDLCFHSLALGL